MSTVQGDLALLRDPVAEQLLNGQTVMRLAYCWFDGTPRVVPHWFHWNGTEVVLGSPSDSPQGACSPAQPVRCAAHRYR